GAIDKILAPLMRLRIVQEDSRALPMIVAGACLNLLDPSLPVPDGVRDFRPAHVDLLVRLVERILDDCHLRGPAPKREVKVVGSIAGRGLTDQRLSDAERRKSNSG